MQKTQVREITMIGLLIALAIVFSRILSFNLYGVKLTISFVVALIGIWFGPTRGFICGAIVDIIGFILFPPAGDWFFGFTLNEALQGLIPGLIFLGIRKYKPTKLIIIPFIVVICTSIPFGIKYTLARASLSSSQQGALIAIQVISVLLLCSFILIGLLRTKNNNDEYSFANVVISVLPAKILVSYVLTPLWYSITVGSTFVAFLPMRFIVSPMNIFMSIMVLYFVLNRLSQHLEEYMGRK